MKVRDIQAFFAEWTPKEIAWEKDNVGLQIGDPQATVGRILVCLDVTAEVIAEARRRNANLIVSHHPLLFHPPSSITPRDEVGRCTWQLIRAGVNLFAAHTNLDFARGGTSFALARTLGLRHVDFLHKPYDVQKKIVTYVPREHVDGVARAMAGAGAGRIGNYDNCSFRLEGTGTFRGNDASHPSVGRKRRLEKVEEVRLEMIANQWAVPGVLDAMKRAHPYEEVAYEVYPTEHKSNDYGMGIIGDLEKPLTLRRFLRMVKHALGATMLRCTGDVDNTIRRVAACGGSGSDLLDEAIRQRADVFLTADVRYHAYRLAKGRIALVDAGHHETEYPVVAAVVMRLKEFVRQRGENTPVIAARASTNPVFCV